MPIPIHPNELGGGKVTRGFFMGGRRMLQGMIVTGDELRSMRPMNRSSLIERGYLHVWPKDHGDVSGQSAKGSVRFVKPIGFGRGYDVIEGRLLNAEPLGKEEAYKLAGIPLPDNGEKAN